jgi:hypothetical protein
MTAQPTMSFLRRNKSDDQRHALEKSQRKATEDTPQNFRDEANSDKAVEIGPDMTDAPIQGIDPDEQGKKER